MAICSVTFLMGLHYCTDRIFSFRGRWILQYYSNHPPYRVSSHSLTYWAARSLTPKPPGILWQIVLGAKVGRHIQHHIVHRVVASHAVDRGNHETLSDEVNKDEVHRLRVRTICGEGGVGLHVVGNRVAGNGGMRGVIAVSAEIVGCYVAGGKLEVLATGYGARS